MGAKSQANDKDSSEKRSELRCDDCERDFLTLAAIKSHTMAKHPEKYRLMLIGETEKNDDKKTALVPPTSRVSKRLQQKKSIDKEVATESKGPENHRKSIFQCPKCLKEFSVFFPALKHIQNRHCVDKDGNPVAPDSPDLIKPLRKDVCTGCNKLYHGNQACKDGANAESENGVYCCLACKQVFPSVASFNEHVELHHDDSITVVILENMNEFHNWKSNVETKQRVKYLSLSNTTQKLYYQCNYVSPQNSAYITHLCPSVMIIREFSKGIHVRYHKDHHEHVCEKYIHETKDNTNKNQNKVYEDVVKSGVDIYIKLKDLLKSIAQRASTVNKAKLKPLYTSALEMQMYLNSLKVNEPTPVKCNTNISKTIEGNRDNVENEELKPKKVMTDDQIVKALEGTRVSARLKRKGEESPVSETKNKVAKNSEAITGLKENNSQVDLACAERFESPKPNIPSPFTQSPSFNDSYKQFIDSTASPQAEKAQKPTVKRVKKEVVKTKIGQFTPSPKKTAEINVELENVGSKKRKKPIVNTEKTTPLKDLKLEDVEYEVVEQENDCNILILKI